MIKVFYSGERYHGIRSTLWGDLTTKNRGRVAEFSCGNTHTWGGIAKVLMHY